MAAPQTQTPPAKQEQSGSLPPLTRRELLNYIWLGSLGVFLAEMGGIGLIFAFPRFREGEFGGKFTLGAVQEVFPEPDGDPIPLNEGKFWLVRTEENQILAVYRVCTHLGCLFNWQPSEHRFICPCHGSQFELDGTYITGPAPRSADRFVIELVDPASGQVVAQTDKFGNPLGCTR
ncbi:MAG: Rieske 2Fe-2S domain-containing protein [Ardenticatenia bacterium]|nr:Rieske 2Fe-2S domain-containing protein [Ardenticatenia bacterium]